MRRTFAAGGRDSSGMEPHGVPLRLALAIPVHAEPRHRQVEAFRAETDGHFGRWLRGIARNKAHEAHRASGRGRVVADSRIIEGMEDVFGRLDAHIGGDEAWEETMRRRVRECVGRLTARLQTAVLRVYHDGLNLGAAATAEGASYAAFAQRLSRARELVRQCLEQRSGEKA